ncbi:efflux transporter outer membrane subunit [Amphritea sp. 1_MG-2023]|uniref:efflux transporter outer membrane subunit n=1 Tax=Amphritea sp. 1_MG-2023 TaxID=3062670 RepID=UPI0026E172BE|nr:efflux transporter outer membrane subunit [Amphritea sp. 1_MG-2023]MDO6561793.1 efflux transporter outer membrane subunit [Amphritea sp. 1_MG-2023]
MTKLSTDIPRPARLLPLACALLLAGCSSLAPDYTRSELPLANDWQHSLDTNVAGLSAEQAVQVPWKNFIHEPLLASVISLALESNRSLRQSLADVAAARATYRVQRADQLPQIDAGLSGDRSQSSSGDISSSYQAEIGLSSYEIDLFGKNRSLTEAQMEAYLASEATAKAAKISLIGEIANAWLTLAADQSALTLAKETMDNAQQAMEITQKRLSLGVDSEIDVLSAATIYHNARADTAAYKTQVAQDINALNLLVGETLDDSLLPIALPDSATLVNDVPAGLSSSVLLQRPDVLAAEHSLKSANADIGVARAAFFPTLSLTATGGVASTLLTDLFSGGSSIWTIAPSLTLPIFDAGSNEANLAYSEAIQQKTLAAYEYAIQNAFAEVADALARRTTIQQQLDAENALVTAATRQYDLSLARYSNGVDSFQNTLEAQRTLYSAQQALITTRQADLNNRIVLYRVLGGGLSDAAVSS